VDSASPRDAGRAIAEQYLAQPGTSPDDDESATGFFEATVPANAADWLSMFMAFKIHLLFAKDRPPPRDTSRDSMAVSGTIVLP